MRVYDDEPGIARAKSRNRKIWIRNVQIRKNPIQVNCYRKLKNLSINLIAG